MEIIYKEKNGIMVRQHVFTAEPSLEVAEGELEMPKESSLEEKEEDCGCPEA